MDKNTAVQLAHQILSCDQPELLAAIVAQFSAAHNPDEQSTTAQETDTPAIQTHQVAAPCHSPTFAPLLQDHQLFVLRNVLASLIPSLHLVPCPERTLFSYGLEVLWRQAPQLASGLHPLIQEAIKNRGSKGMEEFVRFINQ
ncbi:hypothetical protein CAEBREN_05399 [Caenorhabditis brenneri]|uniref:Uncharacterized protein n=1 Tax=Caenorhabditis brenneri TaxID=135651 RepID=G0MMI1_CAEBE|nr:hypothetical protein CAEBREN_05399 [Caenorhabditis brenneri]